MPFKNNDLAMIHSTKTELDNTVVRVVGIVGDFSPLPGSIYAIQRADEKPFAHGYNVMVLTDACLTPTTADFG
jgi:nicotinamidase-related amidase